MNESFISLYFADLATDKFTWAMVLFGHSISYQTRYFVHRRSNSLKNLRIIAPLMLVLTATTLLAGCSREPSENDIKTAYTNEVELTNNLARKFGGDALTIKVNDLKKLSCKETSTEGRYLCQVDIDSTLPLIGKHQQKTELTLAKDDVGNGKQDWVVQRGIDETP